MVWECMRCHFTVGCKQQLSIPVASMARRPVVQMDMSSGPRASASSQARANRLEAITSRLEAIASRLEAIASRLEVIATRCFVSKSRLIVDASRVSATGFINRELPKREGDIEQTVKVIIHFISGKEGVMRPNGHNEELEALSFILHPSSSQAIEKRLSLHISVPDMYSKLSSSGAACRNRLDGSQSMPLVC